MNAQRKMLTLRDNAFIRWLLQQIRKNNLRASMRCGSAWLEKRTVQMISRMFEGYEFNVPKHYDSFLTRFFGGYMTPDKR